ncbi:MAG: DnaJ domain-containing protein [Clostridia bacterium]|nr:DnaJ domain-containing protein [Clostridia bacterium]MBR1684806.1 DnaJ domain-containing protein [Clostridia bacterium]MBR2287634.1 DnaJ domain-containing protein [Clostridia bacterium]
MTEIVNPFELLGIEPTNDLEKLRRAYHLKAKTLHPDQFQDAAQQEKANREMVRLNQAYEEAVKLVSARAYNPYFDQLSCEDAVKMATKLIHQEAPERALRQLMRATSRDASWFHAQGCALMQMNQFATAEQSFRRAVSMEPENLEYRRGAFDAYAEAKRAHSLKGKIRQMLHFRQRHGKR